MTLQFIVMENTLRRAENLRTICGATGDGFATIHEQGVLMTADAIRYWDPSDLAEVDACFVDFDLDTSHVPGHATWPPLTLPGSGLKVPPVTGMSTLLYVRDLMETPEYRQARRTYLNRQRVSHRDWVGRAGTMRLFSFVESKDVVSRLFAAAAHAWFGATYLNAQQDINGAGPLARAVANLHDPERISKNWQAELIALQASPYLEAMLITDDYRKGVQTVIPVEHWPTNYDLFRVYLGHRGKAGYGGAVDPSGFRESVYEVTDLQAGTPRSWQYGGVATRMQSSLNTFLRTFHPSLAELPKWGLEDRADPMYDALNESRLFWTAPDVLVAYTDHLRRRQAPT